MGNGRRKKPDFPALNQAAIAHNENLFEMPGWILSRVPHTQDMHFSRIVVHGIEHDLGIPHDRELSDTRHLARPGAMGKVGDSLDAPPDSGAHATGDRGITVREIGEDGVELL